MAAVTSATSPAALAAATGSSALAKTGADFNMFLKMLTTQMQNQDPLDPMDTSEYTGQLVQYSQVEQSILQTQTLKDILGRLSTQDLAQASALVGREAEFASPIAGLTASTSAQWSYATSRPATTMVATVTDASGRVMDTRALDPRAGRFEWDGRLRDGSQAAAGGYTLSLAAADASGGTVPVTITSRGRVDEVLTAGGALTLGVNGVRNPASALVRVAG